jgi:glutamyl-tRNA synthetase
LGTRLSQITQSTHQQFDDLLTELAARHSVKKGAIAQPLRLALTGSTASPELFNIIEILGPEKVQKRIKAALEYQA